FAVADKHRWQTGASHRFREELHAFFRHEAADVEEGLVARNRRRTGIDAIDGIAHHRRGHMGRQVRAHDVEAEARDCDKVARALRQMEAIVLMPRTRGAPPLVTDVAAVAVAGEARGRKWPA